MRTWLTGLLFAVLLALLVTRLLRLAALLWGGGRSPALRRLVERLETLRRLEGLLEDVDAAGREGWLAEEAERLDAAFFPGSSAAWARAAAATPPVNDEALRVWHESMLRGGAPPRRVEGDSVLAVLTRAALEPKDADLAAALRRLQTEAADLPLVSRLWLTERLAAAAGDGEARARALEQARRVWHVGSPPEPIMAAWSAPLERLAREWWPTEEGARPAPAPEPGSDAATWQTWYAERLPVALRRAPGAPPWLLAAYLRWRIDDGEAVPQERRRTDSWRAGVILLRGALLDFIEQEPSGSTALRAVDRDVLAASAAALLLELAEQGRTGVAERYADATRSTLREWARRGWGDGGS